MYTSPQRAFSLGYRVDHGGYRSGDAHPRNRPFAPARASTGTPSRNAHFDDLHMSTY
jgi:hypothetical protein